MASDNDYLPTYPEHEKLSARVRLSEVSQLIGEKLDGGSKFVLAVWEAKSCNKCKGFGIILREETKCKRCGGTGEDPDYIELVQAPGTMSRNLAELLNIDYDKLMQEKDEMLEAIRANNRGDF